MANIDVKKFVDEKSETWHEIYFDGVLKFKSEPLLNDCQDEQMFIEIFKQLGKKLKFGSPEPDKHTAPNVIWYEHLSDSFDCEDCGPSWAEGANVYDAHGKIILNCPPYAHCFDGDNYSMEEIFVELLGKMGHTLTVDEAY